MKAVDKNRWTHYRDRADVYFRSMELVQMDREYQGAVPLLAVHAAISLADAILVSKCGRRGAENHRETVAALKATCPKGTVNGVARLQQLLARKTDWAYGESTVPPGDVELAYNNAQRFFVWAFETFPAIARAATP